MPSVDTKQLGKAVQSRVMKRLKAARLDLVLVTQAQNRIRAKGDSQHHYPDLWDHPKSFRAGAKPLRGITGLLMSSLTAKSTIMSDTKIRLTLISPHLYAIYHQHGFSTKGPNFIPLTRKAAVNASRFKPLAQALSEAKKQVKKSKGSPAFIPALQQERAAQEALESAGFIEGETYIMAWQGVTVPQRKIFNMPPENAEELRNEMQSALS